MKSFINTVLLFFLFSHLNAQCIVDAGEDIHMCLDQFGFDSTFLNPNIISATLPLQSIAWDYFYQLPNSSISESASVFLNDTSILNPIFTMRPYLNDIYIHLYIQDSIGNTCTDSVRVSYSLFYFFPDDFIAIQQGDTAQIHAYAESGFPPYSYIWTPTNNMSNSTHGSPLVWPDQTQQYQATVTDSFGCEYTMPAWTILVVPTNITNLTKNKLTVYPNPTKGILNFEFEKKLQNTLIKIIDLNGKTVLSKLIQNNAIDLSHLAKGMYTFQLFNENNTLLSYGKIQLE